jgi:hypothetical protein
MNRHFVYQLRCCLLVDIFYIAHRRFYFSATSLYTFKPVRITHAHSCYAYYQPVESYTSSSLTTQSETDG